MGTVHEVFAPTSSFRGGDLRLAERSSSLEGARIGLLFNAKPNADVLLERVRERLSESFPRAAFVYHSKPTAARPMADEVLQDLSECDAVVNAFGD